MREKQPLARKIENIIPVLFTNLNKPEFKPIKEKYNRPQFDEELGLYRWDESQFYDVLPKSNLLYYNLLEARMSARFSMSHLMSSEKTLSRLSMSHLMPSAKSPLKTERLITHDMCVDNILKTEEIKTEESTKNMPPILLSGQDNDTLNFNTIESENESSV